MARPFRFGVQLGQLPSDGWADQVRRIEELGYASLFVPDHFTPQWDPVALQAAAAAVTQQLNVGSLVYGVDYRHPVVLAKAAATLHVLSGGRHEFGIGAGWMQTDYDQAGMAYDSPGTRIARLDEALQIIRSMWSQDETSFEGEHFTVRSVPKAAALATGEAPRVLVGGGGPKILRLAGRHADIVGINPSLPEGRVTGDTPRDLRPERVNEKVEWVREGARAAGRNPEAIEFSSLSFVIGLTDEPGNLRRALAGSTGMSEEQVANCPLFLTGSGPEICDCLQARREQTGISYVVVPGTDMDQVEAFAEAVVAPLAGK